MGFTIKNKEVETLLESVVRMTGETKTEAIRKALEERRQRLVLRSMISNNRNQLIAFLNEEIWSQIPAELLGTTLAKEEEEEILGIVPPQSEK